MELVFKRICKTKMKTSLIFLLVLLKSIWSLRCNLQEKCTEGVLVGVHTTKGAEECHSLCQLSFYCETSTFFQELQSSNCLFLEDCDSSEPCSSCVSSDTQCDSLSCSLEGMCQVIISKKKSIKVEKFEKKSKK